MLPLLYALLATARSSLNSQRELALENLALRQQLAVLRRTTKRPKLSHADRAFWVALSRLWPDWQHAPEPRKRESTDGGKVIALPMVGGLHHRYTRRAA